MSGFSVGVQLDSIVGELEEGARPRTWLVITEKGKRVAQKLRETQKLLEE